MSKLKDEVLTVLDKIALRKKASRKFQQVLDKKSLSLDDPFESIDPLVSIVRTINGAIDELENLKNHFTASGKARPCIADPVSKN